MQGRHYYAHLLPDSKKAQEVQITGLSAHRWEEWDWAATAVNWVLFSVPRGV